MFFYNQQESSLKMRFLSFSFLWNVEIEMKIFFISNYFLESCFVCPKFMNQQKLMETRLLSQNHSHESSKTARRCFSFFLDFFFVRLEFFKLKSIFSEAYSRFIVQHSRLFCHLHFLIYFTINLIQFLLEFFT